MRIYQPSIRHIGVNVFRLKKLARTPFLKAIDKLSEQQHKNWLLAAWQSAVLTEHGKFRRSMPRHGPIDPE
jgi:hypothetical protein